MYGLLSAGIAYQGAQGPQRVGEALDVDDDPARRRHLGGRPGCDERRLHIDHDERGLRRRETVEQMQPSAPGEDPVDDFLTNSDGMHDTP